MKKKIKKLSKKPGKKIKLKDVMWAVRTPRLTGDTAGYGQIVPLVDPINNDLRMLWHSPIGAVASTFSYFYWPNQSSRRIYDAQISYCWRIFKEERA